jgi:hypothetical protein
MRTLQEMIAEDRKRFKPPTMRFKDFCQYIYDPIMAANEANLLPEQKDELVSDITLRVGNDINVTYKPKTGKILISE